jgi:Protein of unknown function (DUF3592)
MNWVMFALIGVPLAIVVLAWLWQVVPEVGSFLPSGRFSWPRTGGTIQACLVAWGTDDSGQVGRHLVTGPEAWVITVLYSYNVDDNEYTGEWFGGQVNDVWKEVVGISSRQQKAEEEAARRYPIGTKIVVRYNPRNPADSRPILH